MYSILATTLAPGSFWFDFFWFCSWFIPMAGVITAFLFLLHKAWSTWLERRRIKQTDDVKAKLLKEINSRYHDVTYTLYHFGVIGHLSHHPLSSCISSLEKQAKNNRDGYLKQPYFKFEIISHSEGRGIIFLTSYRSCTLYDQWGRALKWNRFIYRIGRKSGKGYWYASHSLGMCTLSSWYKLLRFLKRIETLIEHSYVITIDIKRRIRSIMNG